MVHIVTGNSQNKRDGSWERSPLTPRHDTSTSYGGVGQVPRQPGVQPPPPYLAAPGCSYGGYQAANTSNYQRDPSPPPAKITTGRCTAGIIILVILVAQLVAFVLFYDLPTKIDRWSEAVSRMRVREEAMRKERLALQEERERWEKAREDRVPQGAFWETVWPAWDCRSYGKREYWGVLRNIPEDWTDIDACMNTPVEINGVAVRRPHRCQYVEGSPHIHGFWMVDWDQLDCQPWHQDFNDKASLAQPWVSRFHTQLN